MSEEHNPTASDAGTAMVDIGDGYGAVIVWTDPAMQGQEIEVRAAGTEWTGVHVAVLERHTGEGSRYAALFGSLPAGPHELRLRPAQADGVVLPVEVESAKVVEVTWAG